ncbi:fluoride efflux transporter CrcB [Xanthobacter autotrophicus DSM 431]|uniref:fluoride efflux transporter CrcB n=1 Tax=Xanthobacter nonsaccharivorans TaxID=3119912 RepID=UPI00372C852F
MHPVIVVFLGAGTGGVIRHLVNLAVPKLLGAAFPFATFIINVTGSLLMGLIVGYLAFKDGEFWSQTMRLFLTTGILGGYTTFSTFSLDFALLFERGDAALAVTYVVASVLLSLLAVFAGLAIMRTLS